jgi:hypothetical protein
LPVHNHLSLKLNEQQIYNKRAPYRNRP